MRRECAQHTGEVVGGPVARHVGLAEPDAAGGADPLKEHRGPDQAKYRVLAASAAVGSAGRFDHP